MRASILADQDRQSKKEGNRLELERQQALQRDLERRDRELEAGSAVV